MRAKLSLLEPRRDARTRSSLHAARRSVTPAHPAVAANHPAGPPPSLFFDGIGYCSLSEAAIGVLLQLFVPGFTVRWGETYQVPAGNGRTVDFLVHGVLLEYHRIRMKPDRRRFGDFGSRAAYQEFERGLARAGRSARSRAAFLQATEKRLLQRYYERRRAVVDADPALCDKELVVAASIADVHRFVSQRFNRQFAPVYADFEALFWRAVRTIAAQNASQRRLRRA